MKKRVISAILMIAVFVPLLIVGDIYFALFMSIIGLSGLFELTHIIITGYIVFKYSSNSDNFIFLERLDIYTSLE